MSAYARSLPALGFDPAPGDADLTRAMAQKHFLVAQEVRQVLSLVERLDLSALTGRTADALRAMQATFPPALRNTATAAETLQAAASSWANQLGEFQAEADVLERQAAAAAAEHQALLTRQAGLPTGSVALTADVKTAASNANKIQSQAQELHARYLAAAGKTATAVDDRKSLWESTEPVRKVLEAVLAPLDIVAADHWVSALKEVAGVPSDWVKESGKEISNLSKLIKAGKSSPENVIDVAEYLERTGAKIDAWNTWERGWVRTAAGSIAEIKGLSYSLSGLGLLADAGTLVSPQNQGAMGIVDRSAAGLNAFFITGDLVLDGLPGIGEVALAATGLYLAGDFLYQHWTPFRDVANDVGHAAVKTVDTVGHAADSAWHSVSSTVGSWF